MEKLDQVMSRMRLAFMRALFGFGFVSMLGYVLTSRKPPALSDSVLYLSAVALIFLSLWWRRLYAYRFYEALIATVIPIVMFLASLIRHGPYTAIYGVLAALLFILFVANLYLNRVKASDEECDRSSGMV